MLPGPRAEDGVAQNLANFPSLRVSVATELNDQRGTSHGSSSYRARDQVSSRQRSSDQGYTGYGTFGWEISTQANVRRARDSGARARGARVM